jgi:hypothetical protein
MEDDVTVAFQTLPHTNVQLADGYAKYPVSSGAGPAP